VDPATGPRPPLFQRADRLASHEVLLRSAIVILGALLWTYITATFVEVIVNTNPDAVELRNKVEDLNRYIAEANIPAATAQRLREYMDKTRYVSAAQARNKVLDRLSESLRGELALEANAAWLETVPIFANSARSAQGQVFLTQVALQLRPAVFAPKEWLPPSYIYVVARGIVAYSGKIVTAGRACGLDQLTYSAYLQRRQVWTRPSVIRNT